MEILRGDCRLSMAAMAEASVDSIVTDPPYELGFMGRAWDASGIAYEVAMWRQALRVLKPGGYLVVFSHARTYHRVACAIEDAGFDIRDQMLWLYGNGYPKSGVRNGRGTCLKPAHEPIVIARKPLRCSVVDNFARYGTGAMNIDACRFGMPGRPGNRADGPRADQSTVSRIGAAKGASYRARLDAGKISGRWPTNVILDGSDDVMSIFPSTGREGSAARYFYCPKPSKVDKHEGCDGIVTIVDGKPRRGNFHETVKPEPIMRYIVRMYTPTVGGLVLDPFTGSGSTGKAAVLEGYRFVGCELTEAYVPIARARIAAASQRAVALAA